MIRFESDYTEGAHEKILEQLVKTIMSRRLDMVRTYTANKPASI